MNINKKIDIIELYNNFRIQKLTDFSSAKKGKAFMEKTVVNMLNSISSVN